VGCGDGLDQRAAGDVRWLGDRSGPQRRCEWLTGARGADSFVTLMFMGVPLAQVMRLVGHQTMATTQQYRQLASADAGWQAYTAEPLGKMIRVTVDQPAIAAGRLTAAASRHNSVVWTRLAAAA
jgi:hypothetical protein